MWLTADVEARRDRLVTLALAGDVMTGRGVDQILAHPGDPQLWEPYPARAGDYVALAERANGPIPRPVPPEWPWGDALAVLEQLQPAVRLLNLETSITRGGSADPGKLIHYRMSPENLSSLAVARPDACALANNHVLDFGPAALGDTLRALAGAGIRAVGAGRNNRAAARPAPIRLRTGGRVLVAAAGTTSSGIPPGWAAGRRRGGVSLLPDLSSRTAAAVTARIRRHKRPGDLAVMSIHWGSNWGYHVPAEQVEFAHQLINGGVDLVHGHSSHHPRPIEVYNGRLVLYGCGDLIDDYEGIPGYEEYRDDLRLIYFAAVDPASGELAELRMAPMQARQLKLHHASAADAEWLRAVVDRISRPFGTRVGLAEAGPARLRLATG